MEILTKTDKAVSGGCVLLNPHQVASMLGISRKTVYRLATERRIDSIKFLGNLRFEKKTVEEFIRRHEIKAISQE